MYQILVTTKRSQKEYADFGTKHTWVYTSAQSQQ